MKKFFVFLFASGFLQACDLNALKSAGDGAQVENNSKFDEDEDGADEFKVTQSELTDTRAACPQDALLMTDSIGGKVGSRGMKWLGHAGVSILPGEEKKFCLFLKKDYDFLMLRRNVVDSLHREFTAQMIAPDSATPVEWSNLLGDGVRRVSAGVYVFTIRMSIPSWVDLGRRPEYASRPATVGIGFRRVNKNPDVLMRCPSGTIETTKSWTEDVFVLRYGVSPGAVARICVLLKKPRENLSMNVGSYNNGSCGPMNLTGKSLSHPKIPEVSSYNGNGQPQVHFGGLIKPGVYLFEGTWPEAAARGSCVAWERVGFSWQ